MKLLEKLLWTRDEDGEVRHRFQDEWDGNKGPAREYGNYVTEADQWAVQLGSAWSHIGLGVTYDWYLGWAFLGGAMRPYRAMTFNVTVGPFFLLAYLHRPWRIPSA